jgi:hypothetical protein
MIATGRMRKERKVRRVVFVLASGVALVLALGVAFLDLNVSFAQDVPPVECPPGSTYEEVQGQPICANRIDGTARKDRLRGSQDPRVTDEMRGYGDDDRLYGYRGADGMSGGEGQDTLYGGRGGDGLFGDAGIDTIYGGPGPDQVYAQDGERDIIRCGVGDDVVSQVDTNDDIEDCELVKSLPPGRGPGKDRRWWKALMGKK